MAAPAPAAARITVERYFRLVDEGVLRPDDRVELLEGVVVSMSPQNPPHAGIVSMLSELFWRRVGDRASVRVQLPLIMGALSVPEPDIAIVPGRGADYLAAHPTTALLVVEVADSSVAQDRLTKAAIYARGGVPEYVLVNLRDDCVELHRSPDRAAGTFRSVRVLRRGERLQLEGFPDVEVAVDELLPPRTS